MVQLSALLTGLLTAAATVSACPSKDTEKACDEIAAEVPDRVSTRFEIPYTSEVLSYWSHVPRDHKPACLVLPQSAEEVAAVVKVLNKYPDVRFAVKSGGHDPNLGHASVQDGVLISTKDLAGVTYDAEKQLAYVKPGGEWNDVIGVLDTEGVAIVGGRLGLVGVGGYLLQGGISFLSSQYGLAADVSCRMMLSLWGMKLTILLEHRWVGNRDRRRQHHQCRCEGGPRASRRPQGKRQPIW